MQCVLRVRMENAAFFHEGEDGDFVRDGYELARLLRQAADWVELGGSYGPLDLEDFNGNKVGSVELEGV